MHQLGVGTDVAAHEGGREVSRHAVFLDIAHGGHFETQAFCNGLLAQPELLTGLTQALARRHGYGFILGGFSIH